jgi:hypothetical protein
MNTSDSGENPDPLAGNARHLSVYDITQAALVKFRSRSDEDDDIPFSPWAVVPSTADTQYPTIGRGRFDSDACCEIPVFEHMIIAEYG